MFFTYHRHFLFNKLIKWYFQVYTMHNFVALMSSWFLFMCKKIFEIVYRIYSVIRLHRTFIFPATIWNAYDVNSFLPLDTHKPVSLRKIASGLVELSSTENVNKRQIQPAVAAEQLLSRRYLWNPVWWNPLKFKKVRENKTR